MISIAIDGPAAAGKSTVAKRVAETLHYIYIDTGAMYRALTYRAMQVGISVHEEDELVALLQKISIFLKQSDVGQIVFVDGEDVTEAIRTDLVTQNVSYVAAQRGVREDMVKRQQQLAKQGGVVMDGRDIGTDVLPHAECKVFLLASVEERAKRRYEENKQKGFSVNFEKLKEEIARRDRIDSEREVSPLKKAVDAVEIDTTCRTIDEVVQSILSLASERMDVE
ncbi:(d)CMP kinase [Bacillus fonticola]|uniref:(d)CMP kinase n=1 Tax=Bacillus fonticola TaxID=2728853 RepID=UPI001472BBD8|nr:(d)CMP kinase [Bacillus fonticola]